MKKIIFVLVACLANLLGFAQSVSPFTGSFNYNYPLLNLPSNRGTGINIDASYNAGIQMNQPASEIGLGWNISAGGAIYRSVSGIPDDVKVFPMIDISSAKTSTGQGALYPGYYFPSTTNYDISTTRKGLDTADFKMPDFDNYSISAPALYGQLKLSYYKFYPYQNMAVPNATFNAYYPAGANYAPVVTYRKPQFHFTGDFADTLVSRHYPDTINASTPFNIHTTSINGLGYTNNEPFIGKHLSGSTISNQNFSKDSGRIATSNFVEYFRNGQIDSGQVANMIDYKSAYARPSGSFPTEGIGYFRVTGSNGLTYHYSLPVYQLESTTYRNPLNNDYSSTGLADGDFSAGDLDNFPLSVSYGTQIIIKSRETNKYAIKWLLTAITGADFVDVNNNRIVDDGDSGYWISYDYQLWNSVYVQRNPKYGYDYQYAPDEMTQEYPLYFPMLPPGSGQPHKLSGLFGSASINKSEVYHLSKIRTSSHTAVFVRDIRKDEKSDDDAVTTISAFKPKPDLLLKRIILFKNDQLDSILALPCTGCPANFIPANNTEFVFTNINIGGNFYTENWYNARFPTLNYCILKQIVFDQDYSLCKKYHGNVDVRSDNSSVLTPPTTIQSNLSVNNLASSGKLTLNRILTYDFQNQKVIPSIIYDYDKNNILSAQSNPDFNPLKADYWGYYKSDATTNSYSRYTSTSSMVNTKAWSLLKITDPLGGITQMEYESNTYGKVLDNKCPNGVRGAAFIYRIKYVDDFNGLALIPPSGNNYQVVMEEANTSSNGLTEFFYYNNNPLFSQRIIMPFYRNVCTGSGNCLPGSYKGFHYGDCSISIDNSTNKVYGNRTNIPGFSTGVTSYTPQPFPRHYSGINGTSSITQNIPNTNPDGPTYSGNGYIIMEANVGYNVYGGGIRVKRLKVSNTNSEVYVKEYTYENGVATNEMDRFEYPRFKIYVKGQIARYGFLEPKSFERFEMSPYIGYTKVTVKDLGRINTDNGKIETTFITEPSQVSFALRKNYAFSTFFNTTFAPTTTAKTINECVNVFSNIFGAAIETKVFDKNNNMMTRSISEYTTTQQGALLENFFFENLDCGDDYQIGTIYSSTVNIVREIPVVLKSTTTYGMGSYEKSQTVGRDELTGETTSMKSEGKNNSSSSSFKLPAYKHYQAIEGVDFTSAQSRKVLPYGTDMYTYGNIDSTIAGNSFLTAAYKLYSKTIKQRQYVSGAFVTNQTTLPYYFNNRSFIFDAGQGSMNQYGLLDKTNLYSNPLNLTTINASLYWEPTTTYNWKLVTEATLMDNYKNLVETRDANNRFSASRFGYKGYYKTASASNSTYASFTFADFENQAPNGGNATMDGDILVNNHSLINYTSLLPHTGSSCLQVNEVPATFVSNTQQSPGNTMEIGLQSGRIYRASVWANTTNLSNALMEITLSGIVNSQTPYAISNVFTANSTNNLITTIGTWNLLQIDFEIPDKYTNTANGNVFKIELKSANGTNVYFDDFVFHPVESEFSASVYNPRNGRLMSNIDGNGLATNYFYNAAGLVLEVWKEIPSVGYKKIKRHTYNYARGANN